MDQAIALRLKLRSPTTRKLARLVNQQEAFWEACRYFAVASKNLKTTSLGKLNRACYHEAKRRFDLNTGVLQQAMRKAIAARRLVLSNLARQKKAKEPAFTRVPVTYRNDLYRVIQVGSGFGLKFPTASGRSQTAFPVEVGEYQQRLLALLASGGAKQGSGELFQARSGDWYFHLTLVFPCETKEPHAMIGVDLGVVNLAVMATSDGSLNEFFDGRPMRWRRERRAERRAKLQEHGRLGRVKQMRGKETRWMTHHNHVISKRIVQEAKAREAGIALEDLTGIRDRSNLGKRGNRMIASWAFRQLVDFIIYKAHLAEVPVKFVNPRGTSKACFRCGFARKSNRLTQAGFHCRACGHRGHADLNAARNIAVLGSMVLG